MLDPSWLDLLFGMQGTQVNNQQGLLGNQFGTFDAPQMGNPMQPGAGVTPSGPVNFGNTGGLLSDPQRMSLQGGGQGPMPDLAQMMDKKQMGQFVSTADQGNRGPGGGGFSRAQVFPWQWLQLAQMQRHR